MATSYRTPGVYVEEIESGPRPIEAVGTSTAGFVGVAPRADQHVNEPVPILNWMHFRRLMVDDADGSPAGPTTDLVHAVSGFFANGGTLCYVVNIGSVDGPVPGAVGSREGVDALDLVDEVAIVAAPGFTDAVSHDRLLSHCENRKDRVAILDGPADVDDVADLTKVATPGAQPSARVSPSSSDADDDGEEDGGDEEDTPPPSPPSRSSDGDAFRPRQSDRGFGAFYVPWLEVPDPLDPSGTLVPSPPSGHVAGAWALTDGRVGVHKAPANLPVRGAVNLTRRITAAEQELLNPAGVNCIRHFPGQGVMIWGARTVAESSSEWRYLNVRRLFSMIEESIIRSTRWIVFEPNGPKLWKSVERDVSAFLTRMWRAGALFGRSAEEAFFVKCDEETNPPEVRDAGQVVTLVGIAPLKPAEFVIFRVSQHQAGSEVEGVSE